MTKCCDFTVNVPWSTLRVADQLRHSRSRGPRSPSKSWSRGRRRWHSWQWIFLCTEIKIIVSADALQVKHIRVFLLGSDDQVAVAPVDDEVSWIHWCSRCCLNCPRMTHPDPLQKLLPPLAFAKWSCGFCDQCKTLGHDCPFWPPNLKNIHS